MEIIKELNENMTRPVNQESQRQYQLDYNKTSGDSRKVEKKTTVMKNFIHWIGSTMDLKGQKAESKSVSLKDTQFSRN